MRPLPWTGLARAGALAAGVAIAAGGCRSPEREPAFESFFELERTLEIAPIEPFQHPPASILALPDGRYVLPETEGVWIHVVGEDGRGLTRLGGESPGPLGAAPSSIGRFRSLSDVVLRAGGRLVASDRTSNVLSVFGPGLAPDSTFTLPETRAVWQLESLPDGALAAAVAPRHPTAGGQVLVLGADGSIRTRLKPDPVFLSNRWTPVSSTRLESLASGRILAYWAPLPWATELSSAGDSLGRLGKPSRRYKPPVTGPREGAPVDALADWYAAFTPLVTVESAGPFLVFEFLALPARRDTTAADPGRGAPEPEVSGRRSFVNVHDLAGERLAADLLLPRGARLLKSNDRAFLYVLRRSTPRELRIEVWRPKPDAVPPASAPPSEATAGATVSGSS